MNASAHLTNLYFPSNLYLPRETLATKPAIKQLLFGYMADYCRTTESKVLLRYKYDIPSSAAVHFASEQDKQRLLQSPIPLFYDVFVADNKLVAMGLSLDGLDDVIGLPQIVLSHADNSIKGKGEDIDSRNDIMTLNYHIDDKTTLYSQKSYVDFEHRLRYLTVDKFVGGLINLDGEEDLSNYWLTFVYKDFSQKLQLRPNPFARLTPARTLVTMQKDNPKQWIEEWCNYYGENHKIGRIIIYDNSAGDLSKHSPDLQLNDGLDLWYVPWQYEYQQYFNFAQVAALNHANSCFASSTSLLFNFDIDEYLVNATGDDIDDYIKRNYPYGFRADAYRLDASVSPLSHPSSSSPSGSASTSASPSLSSAASLSDSPSASPSISSAWEAKQSAKKQDSASGTKYITPPGIWDILDVHSAEAIDVMKPARTKLITSLFRKFLVAIEIGTFAVIPLLPKKIRQMPMLWRIVITYKFFIHRVYGDEVRMGVAPDDDFYLLHYDSRNTGWKFPPKSAG